MGIKIIAKNKRARYDYFLTDSIEVGIVLQGTEVKSLHQGNVSLTEAYVHIDDQYEAWIYNMHIPHYEFGNIHNHKVDRKRKILMNKKELNLYTHKIKTKQLTFVPCSIYFKKGFVKLELALGKGKKMHDKRQDKAQKDVERKLRRRQYDE